MKKNYSFREILDDEEGRSLVEQIEELIGEEEPVLVQIRNSLIADLRKEFGYTYKL